MLSQSTKRFALVLVTSALALSSLVAHGQASRGPADAGNAPISAEAFCDRLRAFQIAGGGRGVNRDACVEGKRPEVSTPQFQALARCLMRSSNIDEYRRHCVSE
jgi:hypothetical protein